MIAVSEVPGSEIPSLEQMSVSLKCLLDVFIFILCTLFTFSPQQILYICYKGQKTTHSDLEQCIKCPFSEQHENLSILVGYTQDRSQFITVLYSEREGVSIHTGIQTLREKANREAGYERGAMLQHPKF